ncbi:MAG: response regulator [Oleispira sp.]|nr:response regulator [Oleispira sp.]MBL4882359.1 response regulator [Oleispira sp.]
MAVTDTMEGVTLSDGVDQYGLGYDLIYLEDPSSELTIGEIVSIPDDGFIPGHSETYNFGMTESAYWLKVNIHNPLASQKKLYLEVAYAHHDNVDVYVTDENHSIISQHTTGDHLPFETRNIENRHFVFSLDFRPKSDTTLYIRIKSEGTMEIPLTLWSPEGFSEKQEHDRFGLGIYFGIMLVLILYNSFIYLSVRDISYLYYIGYISSFALFVFWFNGLGVQYFWQNNPLPGMYLGLFSALLACYFAMLFTINFLEVRKNIPLFIPFFYTAYIFSLILFIAGLTVAYPYLIYSVVFISILSAISAIVIGLISWRKGVFSAPYYLLAFITFGLGVLLVTLKSVGVLPSVFITEYGSQVGSAVEGILLSIALGNRINQLKSREIQAQQSSIENLERYENLYEKSSQGLFQYTINKNSSRYNDAFAQMFGLDDSNRAAFDSNPLACLSEEVQCSVRKLLTEEGIIKGYETLVNQPDSKQETWVSMTLRTLKDDEGKVIQIDGSMIDISETKLKERAEKERHDEETKRFEAEKKQEISEVKNKAKTQFFASMSHEFRTPLTAIIGYTEIVGRDTASEEQRKSYVKTIGSSAEHMLQLINDVLDLSKIEAQQLDVKLVEVDLITLVQEIHDFIWILADKKNITFNIDYQFPLPSLFVTDPLRLKQALINLCSNAVKFTADGCVTMHVSCDAANEKLIFAVEDTGVGLKPEQTKVIFEAFVQADASTSYNYGGTGLGLYISKLIAQKLGGDITVESEYQQGSIFTINVSTGSLEKVLWKSQLEFKSLASDNNKELQIDNVLSTDSTLVDSTDDGSTTEKLNVLLAEDNAVNQKLMTFHLAKNGAEVTIANDGIEAVAYGITKKFDLILMDMDMPKMDGVTAVRYLRSKGINTKTYALTGNTSSGSIAECIDAGCDGHLAKPFELEKIVAVLESVEKS